MKTLSGIILLALLGILMNPSMAQKIEDEKFIARITDINKTNAGIIENHGIRLMWHDRLPEAQAVITEAQVNWLIKNGYEVTVLGQAGESVDPEYHSYEELLVYIDSLRSLYPEIMSVDTLGYSHVRQLPIPMVKISDNAASDEDEPVIWYDGMHHAREPVGLEACLKIMDHLLMNYNSDPQVKKWVDNAEIYIVPCMNPDGWKYVIDSALNYDWWRKNLHDNNGNGIFDPGMDGTDLNRNYNYAWEYGDTVMESETYQGPFPFSEAETSAKRDFMLSEKPVVSITYHSWGEYVGFVQYLGNEYAPDFPVMYTITDEVASLIPKLNGGHYATGAIDSQEGQSPNWCYQAVGTLEILIETADVFIPSGQTGQLVAADNLQGAIYLLERAFKSGIAGHAWDAETGEPLPATIEIVGIDNEVVEPRTCDSLYGRYTRLLLPDTYTVRAFAENTDTITVSNVAVIEDTLTVLDFELTRPVGFEELAVGGQRSAVSVYPNPTTGSTQFLISNFDFQQVTLKIYDVNGREVAVVFDGMWPGGQVIRWDASVLPAGVYHYQLAVGGQRSAVGKLLIAR